MLYQYPAVSKTYMNDIAGLRISAKELGRYTGKWIVIVHGELVASGKDARKLLGRVRLKFPNEEPFIMMVPKKGVMLY